MPDVDSDLETGISNALDLFGAMRSPLVSVIIPTWNRSSTLLVAVKSVLEQSVKDIEVLVCDDGSTDGSRELIASLDDARIRWLDGVHTGLPAVPRNRGIEQSRGRWLAFLDSDDAWVDHKLERQLEFARSSGSVLVATNAERVDPVSGTTERFLPVVKKKLTFTDLLRDNQVITSSVMVRRDVLTSCEGFPEKANLRVGEDYALWLRIAYWTPIAVLDEPLLQYSDDPKNSIRNLAPSVRNQRWQALKNFLAFNRSSGFVTFVRIFGTAFFALSVVEIGVICAQFARRLRLEWCR